MTDLLHVAVALEGYGWHPEAWRHTPNRPSVFSGRYWAGLAATAERGRLDFVTFDDGLTPQRRRRPELEPRWLAGRLDAVLVASRVAPTTTHIGLIPVATVTHTKPLNVSKAIATLDLVSHGRAGWQPRVSGTAHEAALFGRRDVSDVDLFADAVDAVDVVRQGWDGWNQPVVAALAHARAIYEFAARSAELVFVTPSDDGALRAILGEVAEAGGAHLKTYADVYVTSDGTVDRHSDAYVYRGTAAELVELVLRWQAIGIDGVRLRPAVNAVDLPFIVDEFVPALREAGAFRSEYGDEPLRSRLGLSVATNLHAESRHP
jgi:alkanesulfonate monooxygenase SsuD/methylene tetrahydromethanopterin reductase-like flavin-dependent oxidoreductase (luciferase family)